MKKLFNLVVFAILSSAFLVACSSNEQSEEQVISEEKTEEAVEKLEIFTTIYPLEDFVQKIGGDFVNVTSLVPIGADAHTFEPTARTVIDVAESDALIYNGAGLEGFVDALIKTLENEKVLIVKASDGIDIIGEANGQLHEAEETHDDHGHDTHTEDEDAHDDHGHDAHTEDEDAHDDHGHDAHTEDEDAHDDHGHDAHGVDPHVWLDPILSITLAENIKNTLVTLMPEQEELFTSNFEGVKAELEALHEEFQHMVNAANKDTFLVSHAGYGYWEKRYGLKQIGIAGISPSSEPSQRQLKEIIELANEYELKYVMFEQNIPSKVAQIVKEEVGAEALYLHNLEALIEEDVENKDDYFSLMRKNIEALAKALQ